MGTSTPETKKPFNLPWSMPALPVALVTLLSAAAWLTPSLSAACAYQYSAIANGEIWRVLSGHFFHTNTAHFAMNIAAIWAMFILHHALYRFWEYTAMFIGCCLGCAALMYMLSPEITHYVGLSGVIHGVLLYYAFKEALPFYRTPYAICHLSNKTDDSAKNTSDRAKPLRGSHNIYRYTHMKAYIKSVYKAGEKTGWLIVAGVLIKVTYEQFYGASSSLEKTINAPVIVDGHLYGALSGLFAFMVHLILIHSQHQRA